MSKLKYFRPIVLSRHPSHKDLKISSKQKLLPLYPFKVIVRFGSQTETTKYKNIKYEVNTVDSINNSSSKVLMKTKFTEHGVKTAEWISKCSADELLKFFTDLNGQPMVCKKINSSRGRGMVKIDNEEELKNFISNNNLSHFIYERYYNYNREYRLHVSQDGCFYACRKVIKSDVPKEQRWFRNDSNSNWVREDGSNPELFGKPVNWEEIVAESVKALNAVGLDFGACDVRVQSSSDSKNRLRDSCKFIIVEINSAPSFGDLTREYYISEIPKIIKNKIKCAV